MKKEILLISEKCEKTTVRYRRKQITFVAACKNCGEEYEWLTLDEAAKLFGKNVEDTRSNLKLLREENN